MAPISYLTLLAHSPYYSDIPRSEIPLPILIFAAFGSVSLLYPPTFVGAHTIPLLRHHAPLLLSPFPLDSPPPPR